MEFNKNDFKQGDLLIDLLVDNLVIDDDSVILENIVDIKKQISNIDTMTKILEDSKKLDDSFNSKKIEILLYLLDKAKNLDYDFSTYDFPKPIKSYLISNLLDAETIIDNKLLSATTDTKKIEIVKEYYNDFLVQLISSCFSIVDRKLDVIFPPSEEQKKFNNIRDELNRNRVDINNCKDINDYAQKVKDANEKDKELFSQMFDVMDSEYQKLLKNTEGLRGPDDLK